VDDLRRRRVGVVLLLVIMEPLFTTHSANSAAKNKAKELNSALSSAGLTTFDVDDISRVLGTDGGAVCTDPAGALKKAEQKGLFTNGAAGPGQRPVITDENLLKGPTSSSRPIAPRTASRSRSSSRR
jgi:hypothetical protein